MRKKEAEEDIDYDDFKYLSSFKTIPSITYRPNSNVKGIDHFTTWERRRSVKYGRAAMIDM